jgi:hypothetical protein
VLAWKSTAVWPLGGAELMIKRQTRKARADSDGGAGYLQVRLNAFAQLPPNKRLQPTARGSETGPRRG